MDVTVSDPLVGRLVDGRYAVASRIARGGMATVYLATDNRLDRDVALKVMHPHLAADDQFVARFHREAKAAARLSHPHVVAVYDQGEDGGAVYLTMELVSGNTLRDQLNALGPMTLREALDVMEPVLDALSAAHAAGIIHRDVKPENVLVTDTGGIKVTDFGLARAQTTQSGTSGVLLGTVAYLSPELVSRGVADVRSDVYAAGIMLFEMLTGRQPYTGEQPIHVAYQHVNEEVPPPSSVDPGIVPDVDDLVRWATARDPDGRPSDAGELLRGVRELRASLPDAVLDRDPTPAPAGAGGEGEASGATVALRRSRRAPRSGGPLGLGVDDGDPATPDWGYGPGGARRRTGLVALVGVLVVAALVGVGSWFFLAGPAAYTTTPPVEGLHVDEAERVLDEAGLKAEQDLTYDEGIAAGTVISSRPGPGGDVRKGGTVRLVVSQGTAFTTVPMVEGLSQEDARTALEGVDLAVGRVQDTHHDTIPVGTVISQSVPEGETLRRQQAVDLDVSQGPAPVEMLDVAGTPQQEALPRLQEAGLLAQVTDEHSDSVPAGTIISQDPAPGTPLHRGDSVGVVVSKGPPLVTVPSTRGKQVAEARALLEAEGFTVEVNRLVSGGFDTVLSSSPSANRRVPYGSTVTLNVV